MREIKEDLNGDGPELARGSGHSEPSRHQLSGSTVPEGAGFVKMAAPVSVVCILPRLAVVDVSFPRSGLRQIIDAREAW